MNRLLAHRLDPEAFAKYRRLKRLALQRRLPRRPELAEEVLKAAGFENQGEHLEWGPENPEVGSSDGSRWPWNGSQLPEALAFSDLGV